jgi:hypothetical protein
MAVAAVVEPLGLGGEEGDDDDGDDDDDDFDDARCVGFMRPPRTSYRYSLVPLASSSPLSLSLASSSRT